MSEFSRMDHDLCVILPTQSACSIMWDAGLANKYIQIEKYRRTLPQCVVMIMPGSTKHDVSLFVGTTEECMKNPRIPGGVGVQLFMNKPWADMAYKHAHSSRLKREGVLLILMTNWLCVADVWWQRNETLQEDLLSYMIHAECE